MNNLRINKWLWTIVGILSLTAAGTGVLNIEIYSKVISEVIMPGALGQDLITIISGALLIVLAYSAKERDYRKFTIILGILGYLFYAYGILAIERVYNPLYLVYLGIFGLSFWGMIYSLVSLRFQEIKVTIPDAVKNFSLGVALLQPIVFYPLWISALLPLMREGRKIEFLYSIYILDLVFIMPAFLILTYKLFKKESSGVILTPAIFVLGFILIFSLVVSESVKPFFDSSINQAGVVSSGALSLLFLIAAVIHLRKISY